jgi:hypothetical protein
MTKPPDSNMRRGLPDFLRFLFVTVSCTGKNGVREEAFISVLSQTFSVSDFLRDAKPAVAAKLLAFSLSFLGESHA